MKLKKYIIFTLILLLGLVISLQSRASDSTSISTISNSKEIDDIQKKEYFKFDGIFKLAYQLDPSNRKQKFTIKNLRVGASGNLYKFLSYRFQLEAASDIRLLDAYVTIKPIKGFDIILGQSPNLFFNVASITPARLLFSDFPLFAYNIPILPRDFGLTLTYSDKIGELPVAIGVGYLSGSDLNNAEWISSPSLVSKLTIGSCSQGLMFAVKVLRNEFKQDDKYMTYLNWGGELGYINEKLILYSEFVNNNNLDGDDLISNFVFQAAYMFPIMGGKIFHKITPAVKWDSLGYHLMDNGFDINRLTAGLTFGFAYKQTTSHLRLDYAYSVSGDLSDMLVFEVQLVF